MTEKIHTFLYLPSNFILLIVLLFKHGIEFLSNIHEYNEKAYDLLDENLEIIDIFTVLFWVIVTIFVTSLFL